MPNVVALDSVIAEAAPHSCLRWLSRALTLLFTVMLGLYILAVTAIIVTGMLFPEHVVMGAKGTSISAGHLMQIYPGAIRLSDLPLRTRLTGGISVAIDTLPVFFVFWNLCELFALYAAGTVFGRKNAVHLKRIGLCLIAYPAATFLGNTLFMLAGGADHKPWFGISQLQAPILGLIVFAIAQVMEFGREIEQEKDSFI